MKALVARVGVLLLAVAESMMPCWLLEWVGGWVGGWVEEEEAVGMRCCTWWVGGKGVDRHVEQREEDIWVGGWMDVYTDAEIGGWVGGWDVPRSRTWRP